MKTLDEQIDTDLEKELWNKFSYLPYDVRLYTLNITKRLIKSVCNQVIGQDKPNIFFNDELDTHQNKLRAEQRKTLQTILGIRSGK